MCSDNGLEVTSSWLKALYNLISVKMITTSYYKPNSNGNLEIYNRSILRILRKFTSDQPSSWSQHIPLIQYVLNSSVSETTNYTPFHLLHGVEIRESIDLIILNVKHNTSKKGLEAHQYFLERLDKIRQIAKDNIVKAKGIQKKQFDKHVRKHDLKVNDTVYIKIHKKKLNDDTKLKVSYKGPYKIISFPSYTNVELVDSKNKTLSRYIPVTDLKKSVLRKQYAISSDHSSIVDSDSNQNTVTSHTESSNSITKSSSQSELTSLNSNSDTMIYSPLQVYDNSDVSTHNSQYLSSGDTISSENTSNYMTNDLSSSATCISNVSVNSKNNESEFSTSHYNEDIQLDCQAKKPAYTINKVLRKKHLMDGTIQ